jgi:hypothetical protein
MSLYREAGRRSPARMAATFAGVLVAGLLIGFGIGRATAPDPTAADVVAQLRTDLRPVANGLEILPTEYPQGGRESAGVQAGLDRIDRAMRTAAGDLRVLDPEGTDELQRALSAVRGAVDAKAPPADVARLSREAAVALERVPGGR